MRLKCARIIIISWWRCFDGIRSSEICLFLDEPMKNEAIRCLHQLEDSYTEFSFWVRGVLSRCSGVVTMAFWLHTGVDVRGDSKSWVSCLVHMLRNCKNTHLSVECINRTWLRVPLNKGLTWDGEKGKILTGVLLGVMDLLASGDKAMHLRLRWLSMEGGVTPPGEMGMSSPLLPLLSSCRALPSRRNWCRSGLGLSSGRSKAARLHQPSRSLVQKRHLFVRSACNHDCEIAKTEQVQDKLYREYIIDNIKPGQFFFFFLNNPVVL